MKEKKYDIMILSGGFDPVHKGHVRMFKAAKNMAYKVIVGANSDEWLVRKKGKAFMNWSERAEILKAFKYVDEVFPFGDKDDTAMELLVRIKNLYPECSLAFGNGGDRGAGNTPEKGYCEAFNIDMVYHVGGGKVQSSSDLISSSDYPADYIDLSEEDKKKANEFRLKKIEAVKNQNFEEAANYRMKEREVLGTWET